MVKYKSLNEYLYEIEDNSPDQIFLRQPIEGVLQEVKCWQAMQQARKITTFLKELSFKKGDLLKEYFHKIAL